MRLMSKVLLGGFATVALAGTAVAADHAVHLLNVAMPDGAIAQIHYVGDTPPIVQVVPIAVRAVPVMPIAMIDPAFANFDRIMAAMDAQTDAMMQRAAMLAQNPTSAPLDQADMRKMPAGVMSYSYVSTTNSNGCTQSVRMLSDGSANQPKVIRTSAGSCESASAANKAPQTVPAVAEKPASKAIGSNTI